VPTEADRLRWDDVTTSSFPITVTFNQEKGHFDSLADLWSDWYRPYLDATYPRIMIRFEDYLLQGPTIMHQIAECMGFSPTRMGKYRIRTDSAKPHGSHTNFMSAIFKSGDVEARIKGLTRQDLEYAGTSFGSSVDEHFPIPTVTV
jgi:hypothetical protein